MLSLVQAVHRFEERIVEPARVNAEDLRRYRLIFSFAKFGIVLGSAYSIYYFLSGFRVGGIMVGLAVFWMALTWPLLAMKFPPVAAGNYFALLILATITAVAPSQGGIHSTAIPWLAAPPLVALLIAGRRSATVWCLLSGTVVATFFALDWSGVHFTPVFPPSTRQGQLVTGYGGLVLFAYMIAYLIDRNRTQSQRELEASLDRVVALNHELVRDQQERAEYLGVILHDLNNPMSVVTGYAGLAAEAPGTKPDDARRAAEVLNGAVKRIQGTFLELLDLNLIETHTAPLPREAVDLGQICRDVTDLFRAECRRKNIRLELALPDEEVIVTGESRAARRVVVNFVYKAIKYSPFHSTAWLRLEMDGDMAMLTVEDEGVGIPDAERDRLFRKFSCLSPRPTGGEPSHGLGLFIIKHFTEAMGGTVSCAPFRGKGAQFLLRLPRFHVVRPAVRAIKPVPSLPSRN